MIGLLQITYSCPRMHCDEVLHNNHQSCRILTLASMFSIYSCHFLAPCSIAYFRIPTTFFILPSCRITLFSVTSMASSSFKTDLLLQILIALSGSVLCMFCVCSDLYRFSPSGLMASHPGLSPHSHPSLASHPAIVTPGPKQDLSQATDHNHR